MGASKSATVARKLDLDDRFLPGAFHVKNATQPIDLFSAYTFGPLHLRNRIVMAPLTRSRAEADNVPSRMATTYYSQRASAGLIITEATQVSAGAQGYVSTRASTARNKSTAGNR
jgi:2,4-dienoyl-CoA reductase-like NADH-dependent reductase (Old Yellow Enzyme family)